MSNLHITSLVVDSTDPSACQYLRNGGLDVLITFTVVPGMTPAMLQSSLAKGQTDVKAVPGLADAAFSFGSGPALGLTFLSGNTLCSIDAPAPTTTDDEIALAKAILAG